MTAETLWRKHRDLARAIASQYRLPGGDRDDAEQEALIALWVAAREYDPAKGPFKAWAGVVIKRRMDTALKLAARKKHAMLSQSVRSIAELVIVGAREEPFETLWERFELERIRRGVKTLTPLQQRALADVLNEVKQDKQTVNAVYGARRKLREAS